MINFVTWYLYSTIKQSAGIIPPVVLDNMLFMDGTQVEFMDETNTKYML